MPKEVNPLATVFKTEWEFLGERRKTFVFYTVLFLIAGIVELMIPLIVGLIFNQVQNDITTGAELRKLLFSISLLLIVNLVFWMFHGTARVLEQRTGFMVHRNYVTTKLSRVLDLPVKWHKDHHSGDTIDKINRGGDAVSRFSRNTFEVFYSVVTLVGAVVILLFFDIPAAVIALVFSLITLYIVYRIDKVLNKQYKEINAYGNKVAARVFDYLSNVITVITLRLKGTVKKEVDKRLMDSYSVEKKSVLLNEIKWSIASIAISAMTVIVMGWRAYSDYTSGGVIMVGTLYILYGYLNEVGRTFYRFASLYGDVVSQSSRIVSAYPIDEEFEKIQRESKNLLNKEWKEVVIEDISFTHNREAEMLHIDNVRFGFRKGEKIALIGESGSGKSTMLALLRGLMYPEKGAVFVDKSLVNNGFAAIGNHVTLIPQDPEIFNNTFRYNITMGLPTSENELKRAIEMAQFKQVIARCPQGLETNVLEKGVSLSGGEKQRLALARGLLAAKNSDILLMDEPTSSVDTVNESKIYDAVFNQFKGKTIISALHRLHLLKKFDYIYIFDKGSIVAEGTLDQIKKEPRFIRIWNNYHSTNK
jgi:ABC-type multidrug transport system fused ATPase/permease subunit